MEDGTLRLSTPKHQSSTRKCGITYLTQGGMLDDVEGGSTFSLVLSPPATSFSTI